MGVCRVSPIAGGKPRAFQWAGKSIGCKIMNVGRVLQPMGETRETHAGLESSSQPYVASYPPFWLVRNSTAFCYPHRAMGRRTE